MWTLAHAHGTLLSILNLVLAMSIRLTPDWKAFSRTLASTCLLGALVLIPIGFFLGGVFIFGGDPGIGVILVPPGGLLLFLAVLPIASRSADSAARQAHLTRSRTQSKISPILVYIGLILGPYPVPPMTLDEQTLRANYFGIGCRFLWCSGPESRSETTMIGRRRLSWSAERVSSSSSRWRM